MNECESKYTVAKGLVLECQHHYGQSRERKHQAKYLGLWWYWSDEEADK